MMRILIKPMKPEVRTSTMRGKKLNSAVEVICFSINTAFMHPALQ